MTDLSTDAVSLDREGDVAIIRLDDGKANALTPAVVAALDAAVIEATGSAKALVLAGRDGRFSAGFDLATMTSGVEPARALLGAGARLALRLFDAPVPVVLACTGHALAMGAILLMSADLRVGADGPFKIGLNEVAIGLPVPRFAVELARERLVPGHRDRAVQLATIWTPAEAVEAGFLDVIVPAADVVGTAVARAGEFAATLKEEAFQRTRTTVRGPVTERLFSALDQDTASF